MSTKLHMLKKLRQMRAISPQQLASLTGLPLARIRSLENASIIEEPYLDEAYIVARCMGLGGIIPLLTLSGNLTEVDTGFPLAADVDVWRSGQRLPLSVACRLTLRFGLDDPSELITLARHKQIWDIVERNERGAEPGCCAWCLADIHAGEAHKPTCLPDNLWGRRDMVDLKALGHVPRAEGRGKRMTASAIAKGLKAARAASCKTQDQLAHDVGMHSNHLARIERRELPLLLRNAEKIAQTLKIPVESLYAEPEGDDV